MRVIKGRTSWRRGRESLYRRSQISFQSVSPVPIPSGRKIFPKRKNEKEKGIKPVSPCLQILVRLSPWLPFASTSPRLTSSSACTGFRPTPPSVHPSGRSASMDSSGVRSLALHG